MPQSRIKQKDFPYQNTSLRNLPGERWADIEGYEGVYKISSLGRIKSLHREFTDSRGYRQVKAERVRVLSLRRDENKYKNEPLYTLMISLYRGGKGINRSVGRLMYHTFVKRIDLDDFNMRICYKDKDGRNLRLSNLYCAPMAQVRKGSYLDDRSVSSFLRRRKPITQFDLNGSPVAFFESALDAARMTGISHNVITSVARGDTLTGGTYLWRFGCHRRNINVRALFRNASRDVSKGDPINDALRKKLGVRKVDRSAPPPFLNLSPASIPGERWKEITGFSRYEVSNMGRVRVKTAISGGQKPHFQFGRVLRLIYVPGSSGMSGTLRVKLHGDQTSKWFSIAHLVFTAFNRHSPISSRKIVHKDGDKLNARASNLVVKQ